MTVYYNRVGTCNRCGACCGAVGSGLVPSGQPDRRSPFPKNWPEAIRHEDFNAPHICPVIKLAGITADGVTGKVKLDQPTGSINFPQRPRFYWVWVPGVGLVKDTSQKHDGSTWEPQCPFLMDEEPDGSRPCGLKGTGNQIAESAVDAYCMPEPTYPRAEHLVQEWQTRYPDCSYTWEAI